MSRLERRLINKKIDQRVEWHRIDEEGVTMLKIKAHEIDKKNMAGFKN